MFSITNRLGRHAVTGCAVALASTIANGVAHAETLKIGGVEIYGEAMVTETYDDNIYSRSNGAIDDFITTLDAELSAKWSGASDIVTLTGTGSADFFADNTEENRQQYRLYGDWIHDFSPDFRARTTVDHRRQVSLRGNTADDPGRVATETTTSYVTNPALDLTYNKGLFAGEAGVELYYITYQNVNRANGGLIDNNNRDRIDVTTYVQPGLVVMPNTIAYSRTEFTARRYRSGAVAPTRDSNIVSSVVGLEYNIPNRLLLEGWAGFLHQEYLGGSLDNATIPYFGAEARWQVNDDLETRLTVDRTINPTISSTTSLIVSDRVRLTADYSPIEDLSLSASGSYTLRNFRDSAGASDGSDRSDDYIVAEVGAEYSVMEYVNLGLNYEHRYRTSNASNVDFSRNIVSMYLRVPF